MRDYKESTIHHPSSFKTFGWLLALGIYDLFAGANSRRAGFNLPSSGSLHTKNGRLKPALRACVITSRPPMADHGAVAPDKNAVKPLPCDRGSFSKPSFTLHPSSSKPFLRAHPKFSIAQPAFSLMEVLAAIAIFAIGMVAAASLYPAALTIQKATVIQVQTTQAMRNAKALLETRQIVLSNSDDTNQFPFTGSNNDAGLSSARVPDLYLDDWTRPAQSGKIPLPGVVFPFNEYFFAESGATNNGWTRANRAYPSVGVDAESGGASLYWLPFFSYEDDGDSHFGSNDAGNITIYIALLKAQQSKEYASGLGTFPTYPQYGGSVHSGVSGIPIMFCKKVQIDGMNKIKVSGDLPFHWQLSDILHANDSILDNRGNIYKVSRIENGDTIVVKGIVPRYASGSTKQLKFIWMGLPFTPGGDNPVKDIFLIKGGKAVHYESP